MILDVRVQNDKIAHKDKHRENYILYLRSVGDTITEKISQIHDVFFKILGIRNLTYSPLPSVFREKIFFFLLRDVGTQNSF